MKTGLPELMVIFVTSSYKPELLKPLVEKISSIPEVVCMTYFSIIYSNITPVFYFCIKQASAILKILEFKLLKFIISYINMRVGLD